MYWGDLDYLLIDLPPGTGDMAMSLAQLLPQSELLVITTPQTAAADVAVRAGMMALHTKQRVIGVVENMAGLPCRTAASRSSCSAREVDHWWRRC